MKGALLTAAMLLASAQAEVHKLKLKKIPLSEQLVSSTPRLQLPDETWLRFSVCDCQG